MFFETQCRSISAVPVSVYLSPLVITTKLAAAILVVTVVRKRGSAGPVLPLWDQAVVGLTLPRLNPIWLPAAILKN